MKKKLVTLILSLSVMCLLGGCGQKTDITDKQEETMVSKQNTTPNGDETEVPTETKENCQIPEYDSFSFSDIPIVAKELGLSFSPVENFSNGFLFSSFTVDKANALILNYKKNDPDDFTKNQSIMLTFTPEEYIYDPKYDEARALENATIEDTTVKIRLYTHYNCEGDWRSLMTEQELEDLFALFDSGVAGGGETNSDAEPSIEISEIYTLRWQQDGELWICLQNNPYAPKEASLKDLESIIAEFIQFNSK